MAKYGNMLESNQSPKLLILLLLSNHHVDMNIIQ